MCCACGGGGDGTTEELGADDDGTGGDDGGINDGCEDTDATDFYGDGCDWYAERSDACGVYDTESFIAAEDCCACSFCRDSAGDVIDANGEGCAYYDEIPAQCGLHDTFEFNAAALCCSCVCENTEGDARDYDGQDCDYYEAKPEECGTRDYFDGDFDFESLSQCCSCGGGSSVVPEVLGCAEDSTCDYFLGLGLTCENHFCPDCQFARMCDNSCGFCGVEATCEDDAEWYWKKDKKDCEYMAKKKGKQCKKTGEGGVTGFDACPRSCGVCCADDPVWFVKKKPDKDCAWIAEKSKRCKEKGEDIWGNKKIKAKEACPLACDKCP